jgi:hypothetical protein
MVDRPATDALSPVVPVGPMHPMAGSCSSVYSDDRCQALAWAAAEQLGLSFGSIAAIDVLPNPSPGEIDFAHRIFLSVSVDKDVAHDVTIACPGIAGAFDPPCMLEPVVPLGYPRGPDGGGGYTDVPDGSTPFPSLNPSAVGRARALSVPDLGIPITGTGRMTVTLGRALLANGYLAEGHFALADPWPSDALFVDGIQLVVRPASGGPPLENLYEHGWHAGVEEVEATLTFDVAWFEPGAALRVVDVVVR